MANQLMTQLPVAVSLGGNEVVAIDQPNGDGTYTTRQTTVGQIAIAYDPTQNNAPYVLAEASGFAPDGRVLTGASGRVTVTDAGAGSTITLDLATSGVSANTYGSGTSVPQIAVDAYGRITSASSVSITNQGTVTSASVVTANGFAGAVANASTTPAITLTTTITGILQGNGTAISAASSVGTGAIVLQSSSALITPTVTTSIVPTTNDGAPLGSTTRQFSDLFLASGGVVNWDNGDSTLTHSAHVITVGGAGLVVAAGTTSLAPLKFQSGTNLTTAVAGALEYDGKVFYATAVASSRQALAAYQFASVASAVSLSNSSTSAQAIFTAANDTLTLAGSTTYFFEAFVYLTTGTTSHTTAFGFGGTATFTSLLYWSELVSSAATTIATSVSFLEVAAATATVLNAASTAASTKIRINGTLRVNAGGTIIPQVTFSAGPTGTCQVEPNSFFRCWPVGTNVVAAVGNWS